jgi:hypothetical protein
MNFDSGTAYAESDADDEYERSVAASSPVVGDDEASPIDSEMTSSNEHTPTTYGHRSSGDRLPETIISEWTAEECADFISTIGLQQYSDRFIGRCQTFRFPRGGRLRQIGVPCSISALWLSVKEQTPPVLLSPSELC